MKLRFRDEPGSMHVKLLEELACSDAVVVNVLLDSQHELVELQVEFLVLTGKRMAWLSCFKCFRDVEFSNFRSRQFLNFHFDDVSGEIFHRILVGDAVRDAAEGGKKCDVVDCVVELEKSVGDDLKFLGTESDACKVENAPKVLNGDATVVFGGSFVVLKGRFRLNPINFS
jgi:hypothetical protein